MIELTLEANFSNPKQDPFVARLGETEGENQAVLVADNEDQLIFSYQGSVFSIFKPHQGNLIGDIVYLQPKQSLAQRWIRDDSFHNTLLVTERCDQLCIMCSQPPKKTHIDYFEYFETACKLAPEDMVIGISGGEPTLFKNQLFNLIEKTHQARPDLKFHVLTNGQHFVEEDIDRLRGPSFNQVLWGVPLYAARAQLHDKIVVKEGAFETLMSTLPIMAKSNINIELRTVLLKQNYKELLELAGLIADRLPFLRFWAIMQLERIGFAKNRWDTQFVDHSVDISILEESVSRVYQTGMDVSLYNVPTCTVSENLRPFLQQSISDWKRSYPDECSSCQEKTTCSGFFTWHNSLEDYQMGGPL